MHPLLKLFYEKAKSDPKRVVLPETNDTRVLRAAATVKQEGLAEPVLLGKKNSIISLVEADNIKLNDIEIIDHLESPNLDQYCHDYIEFSKKKGKNIKDRVAQKMFSKPVNFGAMMLKKDQVFSMVAGANHTTSSVIKSAFLFLGIKEGHKTISSSFLMIQPEMKIGAHGAFLFADCAVNPEPTQEQLVDITIATIDNARDLLNTEPRVALLSFSSHGSASHSSVDKIINASKILKEQFPEQIIEGELQFDAAVNSEIAARKTPISQIQGNANVFIFPDLNSSNIGYKIAEGIGGCLAIGPLFQSLAKPMADLSRGCTAQDIVNAIVITSGRTLS